MPGYTTYAEAGLDGPWVTPYQIGSHANDGPVLLTYNFLDAPTARMHCTELRQTGFLPGMPFNAVLDLALQLARMTRQDLYVTHAFHLLPPTRSAAIKARHVDMSFDAVARHELAGRKVIALGSVASGACRRHGITCLATPHPSARGRSFTERAATLAAVLRG